ncbi:hypothetical protein BH09PSE2_BH09PSE2_05990 [soil metagenome]
MALAQTPAVSSTRFTLRLNPGAWIAVATAVLAVSMLAAIASPILHHVPAAPEDDAEYYRVIAANIARSGVSTFDGQTLTNGYHPLWAWILALQDRLVGPSFLVTRLIETVAVCGGLALILLRSPVRTAFGIVISLALYGRLVAGLALTGMEVSLLFGIAGLLIWMLAPDRPERPRRAILIGVAAAAAVLSRIDAAVFVLPLVAFAPLKRTTRLIALAAAAAVGAAYVAYNLAVFGSAVPLSSTVKSLGGLQLNHRLIDQLADDWRTAHLQGRYVQTALILALSPVLLALSRRDTLGRALAAATVVGGAAFAAKLLFGSSWRVWPWYNFPVFFGLVTAIFVIGPQAEGWATRQSVRIPRWVGATAASLVLAVLLAKAGLVVKRAPPNPPSRFDEVNVQAIDRFASTLRGQRVAMGDRAGVFAARYPGGVTQMEGLVNDRAWRNALKTRAPLKPLLCARGVKFVVGYARDLGAYDHVAVPAIRERLSQFPSPAVTVARVDEVGHVQDRAVFDMRGVDDEDDVLYLWRLTGCPR